MLVSLSRSFSSLRLAPALSRSFSAGILARQNGEPFQPNPYPLPHTHQAVQYKTDFVATQPPQAQAQAQVQAQTQGPTPFPSLAAEATSGEADIAGGESVSSEDRAFMRSDILLAQIVNTLMRDGKKTRTQRQIGEALIEIRKATNSNPYIVLRDAIDMCSPLMDLTSRKQGSKVIRVPTPLTPRQRIRRALLWILKASKARPQRHFSQRFAGEILEVINGRSKALDSKKLLHTEVLANRSNIRNK